MRWIDIELRLPENETNVLGCCDDDVFECHHHEDGVFIGMTGTTIDVEYWMWLPDSPYQTGQVKS
jgi:hypothetical protein